MQTPRLLTSNVGFGWIAFTLLTACNAIMGAEPAELIEAGSNGSDAAGGAAGIGQDDASAQAGRGGSDEAGTGQCAGASDTAILADAGPVGISSVSQACVLTVGIAEAKVRQCIMDDTGLSDPCAACFSMGVSCAIANCQPCLSNPSGTECATCRTEKCDPAILSCATG